MFRPALFALALFWSASAAGEPMRFTAAETGNCNGCGMVVAVGDITRDTPAAFQAFLKEEHFGEAYETLVLQSGGGDVFAGMALGRMLRDAGWDTQVGDGRKTITDYESPAPGLCRGACVFALAGGINRWASEDDEINVQTLNFEGTGADVAQVQRVNGRILSYLVDMGIDPRILYLPQQGAAEYRLSLDEAASAGLVAPPGFGDWFLEPHADGLVAASRLKGEPQLFLSVRQVTTYCRKGRPYVLFTSDIALVDYLTKDDAPDIPLWVLSDYTDQDNPRSTEIPAANIRRWHDRKHAYHEVALTGNAAGMLSSLEQGGSYFDYWHHHDGIAVDYAPGALGRKMIALSFRHCLS